MIYKKEDIESTLLFENLTILEVAILENVPLFPKTYIL